MTIEYEQLEEKFDQVRHDLDKAFHDLDSTRKDVQVFRKKTESLEARKFHLEEVLQVKDLQIQQLMLQVNNSANDRADMSMCFSQIDQHIHNLEDSFAQKSFSMAQLEEEISRLRFVLDEGAAREKCVQEELHRKCKLVDQREGELRHVYEQLANQENMRVELNGALESRQHELGELKEKLQASFVNTEDLCRRLHEKETDYCEMKREMWILRERNSGLERINMENTHQHTFQNEPSFGNYTENPNLYDKQGKDQREEHSDVCDVETDPHQYAQVTEYANMHTNTENHHTDTMNEPEVSQQDESYVLSLEAELHVAKILNAALEEEEVEEPWAMVERNDSGSQAEEEMACCRWSASGDGVVCTGKNDGSNKWTDAFDELLERSWSALENLEHVQQEPDFGAICPKDSLRIYRHTERNRKTSEVKNRSSTRKRKCFGNRLLLSANKKKVGRVASMSVMKMAKMGSYRMRKVDGTTKASRKLTVQVNRNWGQWNAMKITVSGRSSTFSKRRRQCWRRI